jgi:phage tail-like protein
MTLGSLAKTVDVTAPPIPPGPVTNGHKPPPFEVGEEPEPSSYLKYLPAIFTADEFTGRFLKIFEDVLGPIAAMVDNQPYYWDPMTAPEGPMTAPEGLLDWMAMWVDLDDEGKEWPVARRRALIEAAAVLYRMRGTVAGVKLHLGIYTNGLILVEERTNGFRLDVDSRLGINTSIGENRPRVFTVTVACPNPEELDQDTLRAIIEADKPVETTYILRVIKLNVLVPKARPPRW